MSHLLQYFKNRNLRINPQRDVNKNTRKGVTTFEINAGFKIVYISKMFAYIQVLREKLILPFHRFFATPYFI